LKLFKESLSVLEPLIRDEPNCFECLLSLGHCLSDVKQLERAKGVYKNALDIRPSDPDALLNYYYAKQMVRHCIVDAASQTISVHVCVWV
jgi:tetratricopeptide (TPR) repeat protein